MMGPLDKAAKGPRANNRGKRKPTDVSGGVMCAIELYLYFPRRSNPIEPTYRTTVPVTSANSQHWRLAEPLERCPAPGCDR